MFLLQNCIYSIICLYYDRVILTVMYSKYAGIMMMYCVVRLTFNSVKCTHNENFTDHLNFGKVINEYAKMVKIG